MQSTQHYIDNERNFIANISQNQQTEVIEFKTAILPVVEQVDIDTDIEREITKLQEAKINEDEQFNFFKTKFLIISTIINQY